VPFAVLDAVFLFDMVKQQLWRPGLLLVPEFCWWLLQLLEELFTLRSFELRGAAWFGIVVGRLLDRFFGEPIQPIANRLFDYAMTFSQCLDFITLFPTNRRENAFSWLPLVRLFL